MRRGHVRKDEFLSGLFSKISSCIGNISNEEIYINALTHPSYNPERKGEDNQRLEFLGDSVLGMIVSDFLYMKYPSRPEGELTLIKSSLVSTRSLTKAARDLGLQRLVRTGRGIKKTNLPDSVLEDAMEALVAAVYLDRDFESARKFVYEFILTELGDEISMQDFISYKSLLQEFSQKEYGKIPEYVVVKKWGPDHKKNFEVIVKVDGREYGPAQGKSKKEAEQKCAKIALEELQERQ